VSTTRRNELLRQAARLFAEKGYHGTSTGDLAEAMGVQKGSLYAHISSKADLLWEVAREGAAAFHEALDEIDLGASREGRVAIMVLSVPEEFGGREVQGGPNGEPDVFLHATADVGK